MTYRKPTKPNRRRRRRDAIKVPPVWGRKANGEHLRIAPRVRKSQLFGVTLPQGCVLSYGPFTKVGEFTRDFHGVWWMGNPSAGSEVVRPRVIKKLNRELRRNRK